MDKKKLRTKKKIVLSLIVSAIFLLMFAVTGCDTQGPAEKAGEQIDQSVENTKEAAEEMGDKITDEGPAEEMGENIDETGEDIEDSVESKTQ